MTLISQSEVDFAHMSCVVAVVCCPESVKSFSAVDVEAEQRVFFRSLETLQFVPALCIFKKGPTQICRHYYDRNLFSGVMNKT